MHNKQQQQTLGGGSFPHSLHYNIHIVQSSTKSHKACKETKCVVHSQERKQLVETSTEAVKTLDSPENAFKSTS